MDTLLQGSDSWWYTWVVIPIAIMLARIADQSLGTLRVVFVAKGNKYLAPLVGFFESIIWLLAVSQILKHKEVKVAREGVFRPGAGRLAMLGLGLRKMK
ncbi:MAG: hypothetical protein KF833_06365 [Verrucomicrobiae bacterium]|nr:hypothetical protein [Verrucomicrobiae bacterium]